MKDRDPALLDTAPLSGEQAKAASASAKFDPLVGTVLADRYEIIRRIGEGGMGAVYEARHSIIGKRVAIKVLLDKFLENEEFVARLLQEARLASSIGHPNIVDVTDFGTTRDGRAFVVMEYLEGEPLSALVLRDAPLTVERSLSLIKQAASALSAAHEKGIVHRDVKPENVYLVRRGDVDYLKVVDFGVSKAVRAREEHSSEWQRLTRTGAVLGTPLFMSPEQASGQDDIDERADIWSTGLMLYECLTGELPFRANNYLGVLAQIQNKDPVSPSMLRPELSIPIPVDRVVMHALEKDRSKRYQTMREFESDLDKLLSGEMGLVAGATDSNPAAMAQTGHSRLGLVSLLVIGAGVATSALLIGFGSTPSQSVSPDPAPVVRPSAAPAPRASVPRPSALPAPAAKVPEVPKATAAPAVAAAPVERVRKPSRSRTNHPSGASASTATKTEIHHLRGDDKVAPSPY